MGDILEIKIDIISAPISIPMVATGNNVHKSLSNTVTNVGDSLFLLGFFNGRTKKKICHCEGEMCQTITPKNQHFSL